MIMELWINPEDYAELSETFPIWQLFALYGVLIIPRCDIPKGTAYLIEGVN